jgi:two-component system, OmpR family, osmolarity sensor histidine kinase EnvZ
MLERLLKPILPRDLMGRAALILIVPVAGLLMLVSVAVIQRHYDRVTQQMTDEFARVARHLANEAARAPDPAARLAEMGGAFDLRLRYLPAIEPRAEPWLPVYELSARLARRELRAALPELVELQVTPRDIELALPAGEGVLVMAFRLDRLTASNPHQLLVLTLLAALLMTLIAYLFLRNQLRPIRRLSVAAEAFGKGRALPLHVSGATEVRAAAQAFLQMRARIEAQIESRTLMLSGISHDLRTPLTRMRLALSLMDHEPEVRALIEDVSQMEVLIDRYLEFLRDGSAEAPVATDLATLVAERVALAARGGARVVVGAGDRLPVMPVRPGLMGRALDNLIGNALRFGTHAEVRLRREGDSAVIEVEDDGPGIPAEAREAALRPFVRLEGARRSDGGVGLGLAIAVEATAAHGGRVELRDGRAPGLGGLRARLVLPLVAPQMSSAIQTGV